MVQKGRKTTFVEFSREHMVNYHISQPYLPNENPVEASIRGLKKKYYRIKSKKDVYNRLWDFAVSYVSEIGNLTVTISKYRKGSTPIEIITCNTPEISEYLNCSLNDYVTYRSKAGLGEAELGRWLGVSHRV